MSLMQVRRGSRAAERRHSVTPPAGGITYVAAGTLSDGGAPITQINIAYPAGIAANDQFVLLADTALTTHTDPTGWTLVHSNAGTDFRVSIWIKTATGSETGTVGVPLGASVIGTGVMHAYRGVNTTTPQDATASTAVTTVGATTIVLPAVTAATVGAVPVWIGGGAVGSRTATSTGTAPTTRTSAGTQRSLFTFDDPAVAATGSTGSRTVTFSGNARAVAAMLLLRAA